MDLKTSIDRNVLFFTSCRSFVLESEDDSDAGFAATQRQRIPPQPSAIEDEDEEEVRSDAAER